MIVTKLTIKKKMDYERDEFIFDSFSHEYGIDLLDVTLSKASSCGNYDIIYTFFSEEMVNYLINLFIELDVVIIKKEDCSNKVVNLIINDELDSFKNEFDYVIEFDNLINTLSKQEIVVNAILDKILNFGKDSLTDKQISILKNAA
jgi:hypothetical protein